MRLGLFYDTETTGLPLFDQPSDDPRQPHIVQLGACLADLNTQKVISSIDLIIRPDGWTIPDEVANVHGITTELAEEVGVTAVTAVAAFMSLWKAAEVRIAHNEQFDARLLRIALSRHFTREHADQWKAGHAECTAKLASPIVKAPPTEKMKAAGRFHHKTANLSEAYKHFTGQELEDAHTAMVDVRACMAVYFKIAELSKVA